MTRRTLVAAVVLCAAAAAPISAQDWEPRRWRPGEAVHIRVARDYHLAAGDVAEFPVVVVGGSATVDGRVDDDLVVIGGRVRVGPTADVRGKIVAIGGGVRVADEARVSGRIEEVAFLWPDVRFTLDEWVGRLDARSWAPFVLAATLLRFMLTTVAACLLALVAPGGIRRIESRAADAPLASAAAGVASQVLFGPALLVVSVGLVVTIVGIPLLVVLAPLAVLAFAGAWLAGFAGVAAQIGGRSRGRGDDGHAVGDVARGVGLLFLATFIGSLLALGPPAVQPVAAAFAIAGFAIEYLAWTVGLGAALLSPLRRRWRMSPPPVPRAASANA